MAMKEVAITDLTVNFGTGTTPDEDCGIAIVCGSKGK